MYGFNKERQMVINVSAFDILEMDGPELLKIIREDIKILGPITEVIKAKEKIKELTKN